MMKNLIAFAFSAFLLSCAGAPKTEEKSFIDENIDFARAKIGNEIGVIEASGKCLNPVTLKTDSSVYYCGYADWRSGFFPGSVWYLYELTGDSTLLPLAAKYTDAIEEAKNLTWHHDIGFIVNCSFGNGLRLAGTPSYKDVMVQAAKSLSTRFRPAAGIIQSWDVERGWQSERGWECPVIIDNMMNLELMFEATRLSGDSSFYKIAVSHADRTMEERFQGLIQIFTVLGFTIAYRITVDSPCLPATPDRFVGISLCRLAMAHFTILDTVVNHMVTTSIRAKMFLHGTMDVPDAAGYKMYADSIMVSLSSPAYRAALGTNGNFLLMHSVGSIPHNSEIDVPLNYADYYYLEALKRKRDIEKGL